MSLTDIKIKTVKPQSKLFRIFDSRGLYIEVTPKGGKRWRLKYRYNGKENRLSLGIYPDISLKEAREKRDELRNLIANDIDPSQHRKMMKATNIDKSIYSFEVVAREWFEKYIPIWSESHAERVVRLFERDLFPWFRNLSVEDITPPQILEALRRIEARGAIETAHRAMGHCSRVFRYAVAIGRVKSDPTRDLRGSLTPYKNNHFAATIEPEKLSGLLRVLDSYEGSFIVHCAMKLGPLVFVRPAELRTAKWEDFDLDNAEWRFTVTKTNTQHIVPLSNQALEIFKELKGHDKNSEYVFPGHNSNARPMSDNAVLAAYRRSGIDKDEATGHGWRAVARTLLDEVLGFRPEIIEHQLAHAVKDPNGRAYNRTTYLPERKEMMQKWADYLDELKSM